MYPGHWSTVKPDSPALIHAATGEEVSWLELDNRSNQVANLLQARGWRPAAKEARKRVLLWLGGTYILGGAGPR